MARFENIQDVRDYREQVAELGAVDVLHLSRDAMLRILDLLLQEIDGLQQALETGEQSRLASAEPSPQHQRPRVTVEGERDQVRLTAAGFDARIGGQGSVVGR